MNIEVLLATYRSERFIGPLIESLATQTLRDFTLVVSDDGSDDRTLDIVAEAADRFDREPIVTVRREGARGAAGNFAWMLNRSQADYVFLADHDDIWHRDKMAAGMDRMRQLEAEYGASTPLLLHGDLEVVDEDGTMVAPSFWSFKSIDPAYGENLPTALMHPTVTGCSAVLNRSLLERVREIPERAVMHDWWIGLVAAAFGHVGYDPQPRISYRIHGSNVSAPKSSRPWAVVRRAPGPADIRQWVDLRIAQAELFLDTYRDELDPEVRRMLEDFATVRSAGPWRRRRILWEGGFRSPDLLRTVAMYAFV